MANEKPDVRRVISMSRNGIFAFCSHSVVNLIDGTNVLIPVKKSKLLHANNCWYNRLVIESSLIKTYPNFNSMKSTLGIDHYSAKLVVNSIPNLNL